MSGDQIKDIKDTLNLLPTNISLCEAVTEISSSDMGMLDDDVDWICSRTEALVWKLIHSPKHNLNNDFHRNITDLEKSLEYAFWIF